MGAVTFDVIVVDPPWSFSDGLKAMKKPVRRGAASQYSTLSFSELAQLDVKELADPSGSVLALWVPSTLLSTGLDLMHMWGFTFKQTFVWVKTKQSKPGAVVTNVNDVLAFGMGRLFRQSHEIVLIGTMGKDVYKKLNDHSQRSVSLDERTRHSTKPESLQDKLEKMFPNANKLEMFARRQRPGWTCVGDAIDGNDIYLALRELIDGPSVVEYDEEKFEDDEIK
jgi:N6-adenosine-specific RNA methylase IME4